MGSAPPIPEKGKFFSGLVDVSAKFIRVQEHGTLMNNMRLYLSCIISAKIGASLSLERVWQV